MITAQGRALADAHRVKQGTISAAVAAQMLRIWPLLLAGRTDEWLRIAIALVTASRAQSAATAVQFAAAYRLVELGTLDGFQVPRPRAEVNAEQVTTSMMVTGPQRLVKAKARLLGVDPSKLNEDDLRTTVLPSSVSDNLAAAPARAAQRHVQNGARDTMNDVTMADLGVQGWTRTTSLKPCWFCAMLASRGPVYDDNSFEDSDPRFEGPGQHKVHDGCGCMLLPLYRRAGEQWPGRAKEFDALWKQTGSAKEFRKAYEGRA